jgi:NADP-dependent aldehyde dehydrogenase
VTTFQSFDPRTGGVIGEWTESTPDDVADACRRAADVAGALADQSLADRAAMLDRLAAAFERERADVVAVADRETALGDARLQSEWTRTVAQCRAFAALVRDGSFVEAVLDSPDPDAVPPRPRLRRMQVPIGPVANFAASNFPFAFSVPGTDTVAALAAGCPVVVKAHPSHPATSHACARIIERAVQRDAVQLVEGASPEVGATLVTNEHIRAVAFTGSLAGGRALFDLAASLPVPIPVYAEMGSVNPVFVTVAALTERAGAIAEGFVTSMLSGWGQFCTSPGVVFVPWGPAGSAFEERAARLVHDATPGVLLNDRVRAGLDARTTVLHNTEGVGVLASSPTAPAGWGTPAQLLLTSLDALRGAPQLLEECFGPVAMIVRLREREFLDAAELFEGSLTATIHAEPQDDVRELVALLSARAGRVVWNGFPTGVAIAPAMHHGGPYPATTHPAFTSVGQLAVRRFLRPVTYQDVPDSLLPPELHDDNPLGIQRHVDGEWRR